MHRQPLDFEKLDVYRCAIEFLAIAVQLGERIPHGQADLRDQLRRAGSSIPLNVAEASGKDQSGRMRAPPRDRPWLGARVCSDLGRSRPMGRRLSRRRGSRKTTLGARRFDADQDVPLIRLAVLVLVLVTRTRRRTRARARTRYTLSSSFSFSQPPFCSTLRNYAQGAPRRRLHGSQRHGKAL